MQQEILQKLHQIEAATNVTVLYAIESGSRAWGFESTDSDYDIRFIYARPLEWYLRVQEQSDVIEYPIDERLLDISGWDLKKALQLLAKGNPPLFEWLRSPIIYREDRIFISEMRKLADIFFTPQSCLYHYLHMAEKNYRTYLREEKVRVKKYLYVLRPLLACEWIEKHTSMPPMEFETLLTSSREDSLFKATIYTLLERKKAGEELDQGPRIPVLNDFIEKKLEYYQARTKSFSSNHPQDISLLDTFFQKIIIGKR